MLNILRNFALARSYAELFALNDRELAARGMNHETLKTHYLRDLDAQAAIASAADRRADSVALPA